MHGTVHRLAYGVLGAGFTIAGAATFLLMFGLFPDLAARLCGESHVVQEFGCAVVVLGILLLWYSRHLPEGQIVGALATLFFALIAVVHWIDFLHGHLPLRSPLVNSVPMIVLAILHSTRPGDETSR